MAKYTNSVGFKRLKKSKTIIGDFHVFKVKISDLDL